MAPGVILSITYFMAVGLTALSFIIERKEGLLDRSWMAGVTATEVMFAHVVAQFVVLVVQVKKMSLLRPHCTNGYVLEISMVHFRFFWIKTVDVNKACLGFSGCRNRNNQ